MAVGISLAVARSVALAAHGHAFDQILTTSYVGRSAGFFAGTLRVIARRLIVLGDSWHKTICKQDENDGCGD
jgi:hypothetical protein